MVIMSKKQYKELTDRISTLENEGIRRDKEYAEIKARLAFDAQQKKPVPTNQQIVHEYLHGGKKAGAPK